MSSSTKRPAAATATAPVRAVQITLGVIVAIIVAMVACSQVASSSGSPGPAPADVLPAGFPVPANAEVIPQGGGEPGTGVVTLSVPGAADDVVDFYAEYLPKAGWTTQPWDGTDPYGEVATGLIINRDGEEGALSATDAGDGRSMVQINLNQPVSPTEPGASMDGGS